MKTLTVMLGVALVAGLSEAAVEPDWDNLTYVTLLKSDPGSGAQSSCIPAKCQDPNNPRWSDGEPIHAGAHYLVGLNGSGQRIRLDGPGSNVNPVNWAGDSLSLAGQIDFNIETFNVNVMRMIGGCLLTQPSGGSFNVTNCYVKDSSPVKPVELGTNRQKNNTTMYINWPVKVTFHGDADQALLFHRYGGQTNSAITLNNSNFSDFNGRVIFGTGGDGDVGGTNFIGNLNLPGTLEVQDKSFLAMSSESYAAQVAALELKSGATLMFAVKDNQTASNCQAASITVTSSFSSQQGVKIRSLSSNVFGTSASYWKDDHVFPILKFSGSAAQNLPDVSCFELEGWPARIVGVGDAPQIRYVDVENGKNLCVVYPAVNTMKTANERDVSSAMDEAYASFWTLDRLPVAADGEACISSVRFIPLQNRVGSSFPCERLFNFGEITLFRDNFPFYVQKTYLCEGGFISMNFVSGLGVFNGDELWICGTAQKPSSLEAACGGHLQVTAPWKGEGKLRISTKIGTGTPYGWISPSADNSDFAGELLITCGLGNQNKTTKEYPRDASTGMILGLNVENGNNLGGAMADGQFHWNGIEITSEPLIKMTNSVTFAEPTRGFYINGAPRFVLINPEDELVFNASVTYCGTFIFGNNYPNKGNVKAPLGAGLLTFAAPAHFHAPGETGVHDAPVAGTDTNNLQVLAGSVRATVTNGLDGVAITFGPEAEGIRVSTDAEGELADYGLYNVKWAEPFVSQRVDGKIPVRVGAVNEVYAGAVKTLAVCTVSGAAAASLTKDSFVVTAKPEGARAKMLEPQIRDDGTVTYSIRVTVAGLRVFVR